MSSRIPSIVGAGLRARWREGYSLADLRADAVAGLLVGVIALPLSMALAIASGVPPEHGLYTAILAGTATALLGGSRFQVTGPTAAFVVLLVPVVDQYGVAGLLLAGAMAGVIQIAMGLGGLGALIAFIPHPVTTGFTSGIALVIGTLQLVDVLGLQVASSAHGFLERVQAMWLAHHTVSGWALLIASLTLALLAGIPRLLPKVPAPLFALALVTLLATVLEQQVPGFEVATIGTRFGGIPSTPPLPMWPWEAGPGIALSFSTIQQLLPTAFAIAMLGAIESLLSAVIADGMSGTRHDPNSELLGLGVGNLLCPFFGGIPATGALARTATNVRAGAQSPLSAVVQSAFLLICVVALAGLVSHLPMAALAALLLMVAKNMSEARHFVRIVRVAPRSDTLVLLSCFVLTVVFDMVIAVGVGVVLAALLFMRRMTSLTNTSLDRGAAEKFFLPTGVLIYEIAGPLFFGAAQKATTVFDTIEHDTHTVILCMRNVPVIDATGLVALETLLAKLRHTNKKVIIAGLAAQPRELLARAGISREPGRLAFAPDLDTASSMAIVHSARQTSTPPVRADG